MPKPKKLPPLTDLYEVLSYDPNSGKFTWKERSMKYFKREQDHVTWNARFAGMPALDTFHSEGYRYGSIFGQNYTAHRVAWYYMTGQEPDEVDHDNRKRHDNRIANLTPATRATNSQNHKLQTNNTSGHVGVSWHKKAQKWAVKVARKHIGLFDNLEEAIAARAVASSNYHPNHGRVPVN